MISWTTRTINILSNSGMYFVIPYTGSAIAQLPSFEIASFSAIIGLVLSASREGLDFVREQTIKKNRR
jgi:hypothetical protein